MTIEYSSSRPSKGDFIMGFCNANCGYNNDFHPLYQFGTIGTSFSRWCSHGGSALERPECNSHDHEQVCYAYLKQDCGFSVFADAPLPLCGTAVIRGDCVVCEEEFYYLIEEARLRRRCNPRCSSMHQGNDSGCNSCGGCSSCGGCNRCGGSNGCGCGCSLQWCDEPILDYKRPVRPHISACGRGKCYHFEKGILYLDKGLYRIEYTVTLPVDSSVQTEVFLRANGETVAGSVRTLSHTPCTPTQTVWGSVILAEDEPTTLSLATVSGITLPNSAQGEPLVTLSINRLGKEI